MSAQEGLLKFHCVVPPLQVDALHAVDGEELFFGDNLARQWSRQFLDEEFEWEFQVPIPDYPIKPKEVETKATATFKVFRIALKQEQQEKEVWVD